MGLIKLYQALAYAAHAPLRFYVRWRCWRGKEDPVRWRERFGYPSLPRPLGRMIWVHAVSVGETQLALAVLRRLQALLPSYSFLLTTGTLTAATWVQPWLPQRTVHQFVPFDTPQATQRFLDFWQPCLALWIEKEFWPTLLHKMHTARIPVMLLNGQLSPRSAKRWRLAAGLLRSTLSCFTRLFVQQEALPAFLNYSEPSRLDPVPNLKAALPSLAVDATELAALRAAIGQRPAWLAASTHAGEEAVVLAAHRALRLRFPDLLTLIAPRHPQRAATLQRQIFAENLSVGRRSTHTPITSHTDIYVIDSMGELGLFFAAVPLVFMGGSLKPIGGHNIMEPALAGCAIITGSEIFNSRTMVERLLAHNGGVMIKNGSELTQQVALWLNDANSLSAAQQNARTFALAAQQEVQQALQRIIDEVLDRVARP